MVVACPGWEQEGGLDAERMLPGVSGTTAGLPELGQAAPSARTIPRGPPAGPTGCDLALPQLTDPPPRVTVALTS